MRITIFLLIVGILLVLVVITKGSQQMVNEQVNEAANTDILSDEQEERFFQLGESDGSGSIDTSINNESLEETKYAYIVDQIDDMKSTGRFGYVVEEDIKDRKVPLTEDDFTKLKKGQYFRSEYAEDSNSTYISVEDKLGLEDGTIIHNPMSLTLSSGRLHISQYYRIDNNTYVVLFFENNIISNPLDHIEVWDADGNKLREIEID